MSNPTFNSVVAEDILVVFILLVVSTFLLVIVLDVLLSVVVIFVVVFGVFPITRVTTHSLLSFKAPWLSLTYTMTVKIIFSYSQYMCKQF